MVSFQVSSARQQIFAVGERQTCTQQCTSGQGVENSVRNFGAGKRDNVKVTILVATPPKITLGIFKPGRLSQSALLGEKKLPADSHAPRMVFTGSRQTSKAAQRCRLTVT